MLLVRRPILAPRHSSPSARLGTTGLGSAMPHAKVAELYKADLTTSDAKEASMFLAELGPGANMRKHYQSGGQSVTLKSGQSGSLPPPPVSATLASDYWMRRRTTKAVTLRLRHSATRRTVAERKRAQPIVGRRAGAFTDTAGDPPGPPPPPRPQRGCAG